MEADFGYIEEDILGVSRADGLLDGYTYKIQEFMQKEFKGYRINKERRRAGVPSNLILQQKRRLFTITYTEGLSKSEARVAVAHELSHVLYESKMVKEKFAKIKDAEDFAKKVCIYILCCRARFYRRVNPDGNFPDDCEDYIRHENYEEKIDKFVNETFEKIEQIKDENKENAPEY